MAAEAQVRDVWSRNPLTKPLGEGVKTGSGSHATSM